MIDNEIRRKTIYEWLAAPDVSLKHHEACKKRAQSTGGWFVASQQYTEWRAEPNAFIWLRGIPGCGKTILSSTIIDNLHQDCKRNHGHTLAYFYHDFKSADSYHGKMLRSLVAQLSQQNPKSFTLLEDLYKSSDEGFRQPTDKALLTVLGEMILNSPTTYIVLDALDECKSRSDLLRAIETINVWQHDGLHTLVTSRQERDIGEMLEPLAQESSIINLQTSVVNEDIRTYVRSRLLLDGPFKKWQKRPEVLEEIETRLLKGADGMYNCSCPGS